MALLRLDIPPGVYSHGTDYEALGRWESSNLVRWEGKSVRPVGGWTTRVATATDAAPRGSVSWVDNTNNPRFAAGTFDALFAINASGTVSDITPVGLTSGTVDAAEVLGFGGKAFGTGFYGIERIPDGNYKECTTWSLGNWGENLVACSTSDGKIYEWPLTGVAAAITNAPTGNKAICVTSERFIFALCAGGDPRKIAWCDKENNTVWTPNATNEAGDINLSTAGQIMCGIPVLSRTLILTTTDAYAAAYQGPPYVYGFERVGSACGVVSRHAAARVAEGAFWMGANSFFMFNGSAVVPVMCDVHDHVFRDINRAQMSKVFAVHNSRFNEVWWFYPTADSLENNVYVAYDYKENHWHVGELSRTTGFDAGVFARPILFDALGNANNHETGNYYGGAVPYVETGPITMGNGDNVMHVTQMLPDELVQGECTATFKTRFYPNGDERTYGPYTMNNPTSIRFTGRQVRMRLTGTEHKDWRAGVMRIDVTEGGKR